MAKLALNEIETNVKFMEELGFYYKKYNNKFWHVESETYFDLPIEQCKNLSSIVRLIIDFEKELSYNKGYNALKYKFRNLLSIDS